MTLTATCYFLILQPLHFPVRGEPGEFLSVWALPQNLWVFDARAEWVVRRGAFDEGKLWSVLDELVEQGIIRYLEDDERLRRPLPTAEVSALPALRLLRTS
jgi:hypothetical protein